MPSNSPQHIHELYSVLRSIFASTPPQSPDFTVLQQVVIKLGQCISAITNLSSDGRVHSLDSLTSSQGCSTTSSGECVEMSYRQIDANVRTVPENQALCPISIHLPDSRLAIPIRYWECKLCQAQQLNVQSICTICTL